MKKISTASRIIVAIAALALIATYFLPVWAIYLIAPQYPEGLEMNIWLNKITGQVEIINGLNHYIGMKKIDADMFPEFKILPFIIGFYILFGLTVAVTGSRKLLGIYCILFIVFAVTALVDYYMWGYDYGHNLDPTAAIQVPGLTYQPPLIGHKTLLNFDAYSYPDSGGWVVIGSAVGLFILWFLEWRKNRKTKRTVVSKKAAVLAGWIIVFLMVGCTPKSERIAYGKDNCSDCKMTIMDPKFGGEIVSKKGKVYKFDDAHCVAAFLKSGAIDMKDVHQILFIDYNSGGNNFLLGKEAQFVLSTQIKSPMGSNAAAFASKTSAEKMAAETGGTIADWTALHNTLTK